MVSNQYLKTPFWVLKGRTTFGTFATGSKKVVEKGLVNWPECVYNIRV